MAEIANWNGHSFVVSPKFIRGFTDLSISGSSETKDKTTNGQIYAERKKGQAREVSLTVSLNALTGITDVYAEAMQYVEEAAQGAQAFFYLGENKLFSSKLMLIKAQVDEVMFMPGKGDQWISCNVRLNFKQSSGDDGKGGGGGGSGKKFIPTVVDTAKKVLTDEALAKLADMVSKSKEATDAGKEASGEKTGGTLGGLAFRTEQLDTYIKSAQDTALKKATDGHDLEKVVPKITPTERQIVDAKP